MTTPTAVHAPVRRQRGPQNRHDAGGHVPPAHMHRGRAGAGCRTVCGHIVLWPPLRAQAVDPVCGDCLLLLALEQGHDCDVCGVR